MGTTLKHRMIQEGDTVLLKAKVVKIQALVDVVPVVTVQLSAFPGEMFSVLPDQVFTDYFGVVSAAGYDEPTRCPWGFKGSVDCAEFGDVDCDGRRCDDTDTDKGRGGTT